ncbi:MAG TPA: TetR/AcrR family transcriptional regulator [Thermoanaerobaculia bacterium]|nr:TetR/AcrR family transcriptional regulator [Thermoanaerobaculia bacterium]
MLRAERISRGIDRRRAAILEVARDHLSRDGIATFTMERVADEAGYARTAIYRYFSSREELIVELAAESLELRVELYRRIARFEGRPRERIVAFGEVTCVLYPRHVLPQVFALAHAVLEKTSESSQERLGALQREDAELNATVAREAVANGDLDLSLGITVEEVLFGLNAFSQGMFERMSSPPSLVGVSDPRVVLRRMGGRLLDGIGWRPLSHEWDYRATMARIYAEVFPPRWLAARGLIEGALPETRGLKTAGR